MTNPWKWKKIFSDEFKGFITIGRKDGSTLGSKATIEGINNVGSGENSHAEGQDVTASGKNSHAEGLGTIAAGANQHVFGKYNVSDTTNIEIVGGGTDATRANIRTLDVNGNEQISGDFTPMVNNSKDLGSTNKKWANIYATTIVSPTLSAPVINNATITGASIDATTTAPTAAPGTKTQQLATTEFVMQAFSHTDALLFKGIIDIDHALPTNNYSAGWTYKVTMNGTYADKVCEIGDMLIAINDGPTTGDAVINADWTVVQANIDGAVVGPNVATDNTVPLFDGTTGKLIKNSGKAIDTIPTNDSGNLITSGGVKTQLDLKAPLNDAALTGTPTAPTANVGTATNQIATTAFVKNALDVSPSLEGTPTAPTPAIGTDSTQIATTAFVYDVLESSPALSGTPTAPTAADATNTTQIATTAFVMNQLSDANPADISTAATPGTSTYISRADHVHAIALATGDNNGEIKIAGQNVAVKGLGTAAYATIDNYIPKSTFNSAYSIMYADSDNTPTILAANTANNKQFLSMTGNGTAGAAPVWAQLTASDITSGTLDANLLPTSGVTADDYGDNVGSTLDFGDNINIPYFSVDNTGRITNAGASTFTLPKIEIELTDLDEITQSGWYKINQLDGLVIGNDPTSEYPPIAEDGVIRADVFDDENMVLTFSGSSSLRRVKSNDIWGDWEWENPPMVANTEYQTTERYLGNLVYKQLFQDTILEGLSNEVVGSIPVGKVIIEYYALDATNLVVNPPEITINGNDIIADTTSKSAGTLYNILVKYI